MLSRTGKLFGLLALLAAIFVPSTALASVHHRQHHLTARQLRAIRAQLLREIKRHPGMIRNKAWLREASIVHFQLPITIRLNPAGAPVSNAYDNNAVLDLGPSLGTHTIGLNGQLHGLLTFQDAFSTGQPGDATLSLISDSSTLSTSSVPLLTNTNVSTQAPNANPALDGCQGQWTGTEDDLANLSNADDSVGPDTLGSSPVSMQPGAAAGDVVLRTGSLAVGIAQGIAPAGSPQAGETIGASGGEANLFGLTPAGFNAPVDVKVNLATNINSILRVVDKASQSVSALGGANVDCRQVWTGYVPNILSTELVGQLAIAPAVTADGHLRIARTYLKSIAPAPETVAACLVPDSLYDGTLAAPGAKGTTNPVPQNACGVNSQFASILQPFTGNPFGTPGNGSEVEVAGTLNVQNLVAEVLLGNV